MLGCTVPRKHAPGRHQAFLHHLLRGLVRPPPPGATRACGEHRRSSLRRHRSPPASCDYSKLTAHDTTGSKFNFRKARHVWSVSIHAYSSLPTIAITIFSAQEHHHFISQSLDRSNQTYHNGSLRCSQVLSSQTRGKHPPSGWPKEKLKKLGKSFDGVQRPVRHLFFIYTTICTA